VSSRKTAILKIRRPGTVVPESPLDSQREYAFDVIVDRTASMGGTFRPLLGDERWQEYMSSLGAATKAPASTDLRQQLKLVRSAGRNLYDQIVGLDPGLSRFLNEESGPRRLVITSDHPEIHKLPWEAIVRPDWQTPAAGDLSIVHALETTPFSPGPFTCGKLLRIATVFGPGTPAGTATSVKALGEKAPNRVEVLDWVFGPAAKGEAPFDVYHIEAHGDLATGGTDVDKNPTPFTTELPERIHCAPLVLMWTCHSGRVRSWGESPALVLHRNGNALVLSYQTELRFDSAAAIAQRFYDRILASQRASDPETAIVAARSDLYRTRLNSCEWASLTVWLRQPVDVSAAALDGPRLPAAKWSSDADALADVATLQSALTDEAFPGRPILLTGVTLPDRLPLSLVSACRGPVVRLNGADLETVDIGAIFDPLGVKPESCHPGDRLLALLRVLGGSEDSVLLWTGVDAVQASVLGYISVPRSVRIVLTSSALLDFPLGVFRSAHSPDAAVLDAQDESDLASRIERLERLGRYADAACAWRAAPPNAITASTSEERRRFFAAAYWALVRLEGSADEVRACLAALETTDPFEALLLRANHEDRAGRYAEARQTYREARNQADGPTARGRVLIELAYLAMQTGDSELAESNYREAIALLEQVGEHETDGRWRAALGRALRDYADLLSGDRNRAAEADIPLQRAIAIHTIDGRIGQVAAAYQTRGKIHRTLRQWDRAESALASSAALQWASENVRGWASSIRELAQLAYDAGRYDQALQLTKTVYDCLSRNKNLLLQPEAGMVSLLAGRCEWRLAHFEEALTWIARALDRLPADRRRERSDASTLKSALQSIIGQAQNPT
jgi:tetratricopeptide (TPR) repeat protein